MTTEERKLKNAERSREWRKAHPGYDKRGYRGLLCQKKKAEKRYKASEKGKETSRAYVRRVRQETPEKLRAREAIKAALRKGVIARPDRCEGCNNFGQVHAHHADYSRRLDVQWLCPGCHTRVHYYV